MNAPPRDRMTGSAARIDRVVGAVNIGSFRISAMIAGIGDTGVTVMGSGHRASAGIKRGYVTDMSAASHAVRDAIERAERIAAVNVGAVWIGCSGAGLQGALEPVEIDIGGRRIEEEDVEHLLANALQSLGPDGRTVLHAQPACYMLDGADGVANPIGLHAERLGVDIHVLRADSAPLRNLSETVQHAHLDVAGIIASPLASAQACLSEADRDLGVALVELGAQVTIVSVHAGGMLAGLVTIARGSADITEAIAGACRIRPFEAERLKCKHGSAIASPADNREMIAMQGAGEGHGDGLGGGDDERAPVPRAELVSVITSELDTLLGEVARALEGLGFAVRGGRDVRGPRGRQVVLTGGGAELAGIADYAQGVLGVPVRIGRPPALAGLPEAHATPGFATLAGLVCHVASDPVDIRNLGPRFTNSSRPAGVAAMSRVWRAVKDYF